MNITKLTSNKRAQLFCGLALAMAAQAGFASTAPSLVQNCSTEPLVHPENADTVYFNEGCTIGYVTPPKVGDLQTTAFLAMQGNIDNFCPSVDSVAQTETTLGDLIRRYQARINAIEEQIDEVALETLNTAVINAQGLVNAKQITVDLEENRSKALFDEIKAAKEAYNDCKILALDPVLECQVELDLFLETRTAYIDHKRNVLYPLQDEIAVLKGDVAIAQAAYDAKLLSYKPQFTILNDLKFIAEGLEMDATALYDKYALISGATATMLFHSNWSKLVNDYRTANANNQSLSGVSWKRMPLKKSYLSGKFNNSKASHGARLIPLILQGQVPGYITYDFFNQPNGLDSLEPQTTEDDYALKNKTFVSDTFSSGITLSLVGACDVNKNPNYKNDIAALMTISFNADYETMVRAGYDAYFNLYAFYQKIESVRKKRRFFSSSSVRTVAISNYSSSQFRITWDTSGSSGGWISENQEELTTQVRERLTVHVLDQIGIRTTTQPTESSDGTLTIGPSPASQLGSALIKSCAGGPNYLCYAGWIIGGIGSLWGNGSAANNFVASNNHTSRETVNTVFFEAGHAQTQFVNPAAAP